MRRWDRVPTATFCGNCGHLLPPGTLAIYIKLRALKRELIRGECCMGSAPPDIAASIPHRTTSPMVPTKKIAHQFGGKIWKHG